MPFGLRRTSRLAASATGPLHGLAQGSGTGPNVILQAGVAAVGNLPAAPARHLAVAVPVAVPVGVAAGEPWSAAA